MIDGQRLLSLSSHLSLYLSLCRGPEQKKSTQLKFIAYILPPAPLCLILRFNSLFSLNRGLFPPKTHLHSHNVNAQQIVGFDFGHLFVHTANAHTHTPIPKAPPSPRPLKHTPWQLLVPLFPYVQHGGERLQLLQPHAKDNGIENVKYICLHDNRKREHDQQQKYRQYNTIQTQQREVKWRRDRELKHKHYNDT